MAQVLKFHIGIVSTFLKRCRSVKGPMRNPPHEKRQNNNKLTSS
jgi:hypothetical protein